MPKQTVLSFDTETTGLDHHHGARPYYVTICRDDGTQAWWEWDVDPLTRKVRIVEDDLDEVQEEFEKADVLVAQNGKFDVHALTQLFQDRGRTFRFDWSKLEDTLVAGHVLASNHPHDLTTMVLEHLGRNVQPVETALERACNEARKTCRLKRWRGVLSDWRVARHGLPEMPSAKKGSGGKSSRGGEHESNWKYDAWLPRAIAERLGYPEDHSWRTVLRDYSNTDSASTLALWMRMERLLKDRGHRKLYREQLKLCRITWKMERRGVTASEANWRRVHERCAAEVERTSGRCMEVARKHRVRCQECEGSGSGPDTLFGAGCPACGGEGSASFDLVLPKGAINGSLKTFCLDVLKLPKVRNPKSKTGEPTLDSKNAIPHWQRVLPEGDALDFVNALAARREHGTALTFLESYRRFWLPLEEGSENGLSGFKVLHPSLNNCGTDTLRLSSSNPNGQQVSKRKAANLRSVFGPAPGREWWSLDAENIELRIPAYESGQRELIDLFENPGPPFWGSEHLLNFSVVYPDLWEAAVDKVGIEEAGKWVKEEHRDTWYQRVKNGDFAIQYGAVNRADGVGTADRTFGRPGSQSKLEQRFHGKTALNRRWVEVARRTGRIETMPDRTVDPEHGYPLLVGRSSWGESSPTQPLAYRVSGTACWWMRRAMVRVDERLERWEAEDPRGWWMVLSVHDELGLDFPRGRGGKPWLTNLGKIMVIKRLMERGGTDLIPPVLTPVAVTYHPDNWGEGVSMRDELKKLEATCNKSR